ncbi:MAG: YiiX/YebB-like N1pC/P60 family cysteine hydrolase [Methylococcales bacterium]|jgi:hypothetical protein|nr:YiiX/YebB-like N1pC/P60 family cysteine hydrolase [Methylococcales bacterium]
MKYPTKHIADQIKLGDIIFIAIPNYFYRKIAKITNSWVSHVGWVHSHNGHEYLIAESAVPFVRLTLLSKFVNRSDNGKIAIRRLIRPITKRDIEKLTRETNMKMGSPYHLWFNYQSSWQFCSKFIYDVYNNALGIKIGHLQTFNALLTQNPNQDLCFWRVWFCGFIPWNRKTITPDSQYKSDRLETIYDNNLSPVKNLIKDSGVSSDSDSNINK